MSQITLKDIARKAGVSQSAVSRVLNNRDTLVGEETKQKVLKIAKELNYQPNVFARSLKTGQTNIVAVSSGSPRPLMELFYQPYATAVLAGVGDILADQDYKLIFYRFKQQNGATAGVPQPRLVDGIIFILVADLLDDFIKNQQPLLKALNLPFVVIHSLREKFDFFNVGVDCRAGAYEVTKHLAEHHKYRQIGFVTRQRPTAFYNDMHEGYQQALAEQGLNARPEHQFRTASIMATDGYNLADRMLADKLKLPRALVCTEDPLARGIIRRFGEAGVRVPEDVAVTGFGDLSNLDYDFNDLTGFRQPAHQKGDLAARMLLDIINGKKDINKPESLILKPELVIRKSCGCR